MRRGLTALGIFASLLVATPATAGGIDTYEAPVSGSDLLQTPRAHAETGHLTAFGRLSLAYNNDPLVWRDSTGAEVRIVNHQFGAHGALGMVLWKRLQLAFMLPVYYQSGEAPSGQSAMDDTALGDAAFDLRFALLTRDDPIEVALTTRLALPSGNEIEYVGDGRFAANFGAIVSREFGKDGLLLTSSIKASARDRATQGTDDGGSAVLLGLGAALPVAERVALTCEADVATELSDFFGETSTPASLLVGARYGFAGWLTHLGAGPGLTRGVGTPDFRVLAMIGTNGDAEPEPATAQPTAAAATATDSDADGLLDTRDGCIHEAEDKDAFQDDDGCPEADNDSDLVPDSSDKCPGDAEDRDSFQDQDGCPEADNDGDAVPDSSDKCPGDAEDKDAFQDEDGCPEADNDGDGVADGSDQCPNEKETPNGSDDADGCPDLLRVDQEQIRTLEPIYFDPGSDRLQARSLPLVQELASVIASRQDLGMISIEGHTDNVGSETANLTLSQKRADAIRRVLIENGVPESRLTATGYGEMRPIASNESKAGKLQNRRVEFRLAGAIPSAGAAP